MEQRGGSFSGIDFLGSIASFSLCVLSFPMRWFFRFCPWNSGRFTSGMHRCSNRIQDSQHFQRSRKGVSKIRQNQAPTPVPPKQPNYLTKSTLWNHKNWVKARQSLLTGRRPSKSHDSPPKSQHSPLTDQHHRSSVPYNLFSYGNHYCGLI